MPSEHMSRSWRSRGGGGDNRGGGGVDRVKASLWTVVAVLVCVLQSVLLVPFVVHKLMIRVLIPSLLLGLSYIAEYMGANKYYLLLILLVLLIAIVSVVWKYIQSKQSEEKKSKITSNTIVSTPKDCILESSDDESKVSVNEYATEYANHSEHEQHDECDSESEFESVESKEWRSDDEHYYESEFESEASVHMNGSDSSGEDKLTWGDSECSSIEKQKKL